MADVSVLSGILKKLMREYAQIKPANSRLQVTAVIDERDHHYLLITSGWENAKDTRFTYYVSVHIHIADGKLLVLRDNRLPSIAEDLLAAGIPAEQIVLGMVHPQHRRPPELALG